MPYGIVEKVKKGSAMVRMQRQEMCAGCHACDAMYDKKDCVLRCVDPLGSKVGDTVQIEGVQENFLKASYILYGLPLVGFIAGLCIALKLSSNLGESARDLSCVIGALIGMGIMLGFIKLREGSEHYKKYLPKIISKIDLEKEAD